MLILLRLRTSLLKRNSNRRVGLGQGTRATSLDEVLLLVVVNVEVVKHVDSSALVCTDVVICKVDNDSENVVTLSVLKTFHDRNSDNLLNTKHVLELLKRIIDHTTGVVLEKEAVGNKVLSGIQSRLARTLIVLTGLDYASDERFSLIIGSSIVSDGDLGLDGVKISIRYRGKNTQPIKKSMDVAPLIFNVMPKISLIVFSSFFPQY